MKIHRAIQEEKRYAKQKAREIEKRMRAAVIRQAAIEFFKWATKIAEEFESRFEDKGLSRIGKAT